MRSKNILLAYIISSCNTAWFWLGIWVFYYLRITNYTGIGLIETVLIVTRTVSEIPTGAVADLLGKKITLVTSLLLDAVCQFFMAATNSLAGLLGAVFIGGLGGSLYSGTMDAFIYDSLKENESEDKFNKVIANIQTIQLITMVVCTLIGGVAYSISPRLPFILSGIGCVIGIILSLFLTEPSVDTAKFSLPNFVYQTKQGFIGLFKDISIRKQTLMLLSIGGIFVISSEMLDSILGVEFGFDNKSLSLLTAVVLIITSVAVQITPVLRKKFSDKSIIIVIGLVSVLVYTASPFVMLYIGGIMLIMRQSLDSVFQNISLGLINQSTPSKYRATTISTFNMVKNIPYVASALFLGRLMDLFSARIFTFFLGVTLFILIFFIFWVLGVNKVSPTSRHLDR